MLWFPEVWEDCDDPACPLPHETGVEQQSPQTGHQLIY